MDASPFLFIFLPFLWLLFPCRNMFFNEVLSQTPQGCCIQYVHILPSLNWNYFYFQNTSGYKRFTWKIMGLYHWRKKKCMHLQNKLLKDWSTHLIFSYIDFSCLFLILKFRNKSIFLTFCLKSWLMAFIIILLGNCFPKKLPMKYN